MAFIAGLALPLLKSSRVICIDEKTQIHV